MKLPRKFAGSRAANKTTNITFAKNVIILILTISQHTASIIGPKGSQSFNQLKRNLTMSVGVNLI